MMMMMIVIIITSQLLYSGIFENHELSGKNDVLCGENFESICGVGGTSTDR
jgi:hypothetical protein